MPKLSVIVPVYNAQKYLVRCLDSILNQSFKNIEVICINDGSTDDSLSILNEYKSKDPRVTVIVQNNQGQSIARNYGLTVAKGDYVSFIDSDDYISDEMFSTLIDIMAQDNCDLVICGVNVIYESWNEQKWFDEEYFKINSGRKITVQESMFGKINTSCWNKLFRRKLINQYSIRFPEGLWYEDSGFFRCYISVCNTLSAVDTKFYNYIKYQNSTMGKTFSGTNIKVLDHITVADYVLEFLRTHNLLKKYIKSSKAYLADSFLFSFKFLPFSEKQISLKKIFLFLKSTPEIDIFDFSVTLFQITFLKLSRKIKIFLKRFF